jgi:hypothetical protein
LVVSRTRSREEMGARYIAFTALCLALLVSGPFNINGQLLPTDWQKAVVLVEREVKVDAQSQYLSAGTGFLVGRTADGGNRRVHLITAKHILAELLSQGNKFCFRVDTRDGPFARVSGNLAVTRHADGILFVGVPANRGEVRWLMHSQFDVAAIEVSNLQVPPNADYRVFDSGLLATKEVYDSLGLAETDLTYVIVYDIRVNTRLVRAGMVSKVLEMGSFFMESRNFPGDSGSPVVLQPAISRKPGVIQPTTALIIGLVSDISSGLVPIAKFGQTDLLFPESMDLSVVQPSYRILELLSAPN